MVDDDDVNREEEIETPTQKKKKWMVLVDRTISIK